MAADPLGPRRRRRYWLRDVFAVPVFALVGGFVSGVLVALIYNGLFRSIGDLELELEEASR